jgi:exonuclease III
VVSWQGKEALGLLLKPPRTPRPYSSVIVVGVYYPPGQSKENEHEMQDYLTQKMDIALAERPSAGIFVTGDFNKLDLNPLCCRFNLRKQAEVAHERKKHFGPDTYQYVGSV